MPLEGFRILDWASATFDGLAPMVVGGLGVALLIAGIVVAVLGIKMVPISWALVTAGGGAVVLTYFIVGAAIHGASSAIAGGEEVQSMAPRMVPYCVAAIAIGLALFGMRAALGAWSSEETTGKVVGLLILLVSLSGVFVGVQVIRGSLNAPPATTTSDPVTDPAPADDGPVRRRGLTSTPRR